MYGLLESSIDERDYMYGDILNYSGTAIPREIILNNKFFKNQLSTGTCFFQSYASMKEMIHNTNEMLSEGFVNAQRTEEDMQTTGISARNGLKIACRVGIISKKDFPLLLDYPQIKNEFEKLSNKEELRKKALDLKSEGYVRIDINDIPAYIAQERKPVLICCRIFESFNKIDKNTGKIPYPHYGNKLGNHAMVCIGYSYDKFGTLHLYVLNSWGYSWGKNGCCWIDIRDDMIFEAWGLLDKKKPISINKTLYRVQVGSFRVRENADKLSEELRNKGIANFVKIYPGYYKVQCGAFYNKDNAFSLRDKIKAMHYDAFIVSENNYKI